MRELRLRQNVEHARSLLLRLEHDSANIKVASRKQAVQADLQAKRELTKRLQVRLQELNQLEDDSDSESEEEDEPNPSYAPANNASSGLDREPSSAQEAAANLSSTLRNRNKNGAPSSDAPTATTTQSNRYGTSDTASLQDRESLLSAHRGEQESITTSLVTLAQQLKLSAQNFSMSLESEKDVVNRAVEGLDRNVSGMDIAGKTMGTLKRLTEGKGWWGRMMLYAWIGGLWVLALVVVFVLPKLRF